MKYSIPVRSLAFAIHAAAKNDVRYYFNAVRVSGTDCTATDGRMMLRIRDDAQLAPQPLLIPRDAVAWAIKAATAAKADVAAIARAGSDLTLEVGGLSLRATAAEDRWPDVDLIVPAAYDPCLPAAYNPDLLTRFAKAATVVGKRVGVRIMPRDGGSVVDFPGAPVPCFGVIMSRRDSVGTPTTFTEAK